VAGLRRLEPLPSREIGAIAGEATEGIVEKLRIAQGASKNQVENTEVSAGGNRALRLQSRAACPQPLPRCPIGRGP
jgi:hypothetical protein